MKGRGGKRGGWVEQEERWGVFDGGQNLGGFNSEVGSQGSSIIIEGDRGRLIRVEVDCSS